MTRTKIGRNDPCPCGSGRKYKSCCSSKPAAEARRSQTSAQPLIKAGKQDLARQAIEKNPGNHLTWRTAAEVALDANRFRICENFCRKALALEKDDPESLYLLGTALARQKQFEEAQQYLAHAVTLDPAHWRACNNLGNVYRETGRHDKALAYFEKVFANPSSPSNVLSNILLGMHFHLDADHQRLFDMHCSVGAGIEAGVESPLPALDHVALHKKIRIGYFSPRFKPGVIGDFFTPLFDAHDRSRFELYLYSNTVGSNECSEYLAQNADSWTETRLLSDERFADLVRTHEIDIFVDLAGHAPGNRLAVFAYKPAPVQISMLDYFDTTGMTVFDYYISDHCSTPANCAQQFTEKLIRMSQPRLVYQPSDACPSVGDLPALRNGYLTFGSFNRNEKITGQVVELWAQILTRLPSSRLILKDKGFDDPGIVNRYTELFARFKVAPSRIEFKGWSDHGRLLEEYKSIDIALDPFPYNGGLTTCEALWMGVPVLSLLGSSIISRQSACMMRSLGLDAFVGETPDCYVDTAVRWADDLEGLSRVRRELRSRAAASPLFNGVEFAHELEAHFANMVHHPAEIYTK